MAAAFARPAFQTTRHRLALLLPVAFVLAFALSGAHANTASTATPAEALAALAEQYIERQFALNPIRGTFAGEAKYNNRFVNNQTAAFRAEEKALHTEMLTRLAAINAGQLGEPDRITHDVLKHQATNALESQRHDFHLLVLNHFYSVPLTLVQFASTEAAQPFRTVADYDAFLERVEGFPAWADSAMANLREGITRGMVQPKVIAQRVLTQLKSQVVSDPVKSGFYRPVLKFPATFSEADRTRLTEAYRRMVVEKMTPAFTRLADFVEKDYLPKCRDTSGIGTLPGGQAAYAFRARESTTTTYTPDEIHNIGLKEVARIRAEMDKVRKTVGFAGDLNAFLASITENPALMPFKTEDEVIAAYRVIQRRVEPLIGKLFSRIPRAALEIRPEPALTRATAAAHYNSGAPDGSRPGVFYAPVRDAATYTTPKMTSLFLHEGLPGHHFEVSLAQESNLPRYRRYTRFTAYGEGWGLYAESLGQEMGVYDDPYQYLGRLLAEMHRSIRLVVDTGMHAKGWTREQAIRYSIETEGGREQDQIQEIERYMAIPGQALAYKIGEIRIFELRRLAEARLGRSFKLAEFHTEILKDGNLPLEVLEAKVKRWIERQAKTL